jgi:hypothetical protein
VLPTTQHEGHHTHEHHQDADPEPTKGSGEPPDHKQAHPHHRDRDLDREQHQAKVKEPTLLPAREAGCNGGLIRIANAVAVPDRATDPGPSVVVEVILEGQPPFRAATLLNLVVHHDRLYPRLLGPSRAGRRGEGTPPTNGSRLTHRGTVLAPSRSEAGMAATVPASRTRK